MRLELSRSHELVQNPLVWVTVLVVLATLSPYILPFVGAEARAEYGDVWADIPLIGLIIFLIFYHRPVARSQREQQFWLALGTGFSLWFVGRLAWGILFSVGLPIDLVADFLYLLLYASILVALELDPSGRPPTEFGKLLRRYTLGGGMVLFLAGYIYFALLPAVANPQSYESWKPAVIGTVIFDLYVTIRLILRYRAAADPYWRRVYRWMALAFALWVVTDTLEVIWLYNPLATLEPGSLLDLMWYLPYVLFVVSVLAGRQEGEIAPRPMVSSESVIMADPLGGSPLVAYALALPLIHTILELTGMYDQGLRLGREILLVVETLILATLIFKTHRLVLGENRRLRQGYEDISRTLEMANRGLEDRVVHRTAELEEANRLLAIDIEKRTRVEKRLRATEERNRALIQAVPDSLILVDHDGMVRDAFPSGTDLTFLDPVSELGRPLCEMVPPDYQAAIAEAVTSISKGQKQKSVSISVLKAQKIQYLDFRFGRCGEKEILVLIQDVTERRDFEASLLQSQKLESLGIMAGGIAHDFNNLLASILGNAQLAREHLAEDASIPQPLAAIESSAMRAAKLTSNLLAYAGEAHIELEPLDLSKIFADMSTLLASTIPKRTRFTFEIEPEAMWVDGNEAQMTQILLNLVRNAAESLVGRSGEVRVEIQRCRISESGLFGRVMCEKPCQGPYIMLRVQDTGCGIAPENQERIFDPFFTSKGTGRGLGLAAVMGIVSHHGGALTLESAPEAGTAFTVYFPARAEPVAQAVAPRRQDKLAQGSGTILVVDDEKDVRHLITTYLGMRGFTIVEAENGIQAVAQAETYRGRLSAIFMDYSMPEMSGAEAFHAIRKESREVPVVMMSGYGERETLGALADEHRTAFLSKPFELSEITRALDGFDGLIKKEAQG